MNWRARTRFGVWLSAGVLVAAGTLAIASEAPLVAPTRGGALAQTGTLSHQISEAPLRQLGKQPTRSASPTDLGLQSLELASMSRVRAAATRVQTNAQGLPACKAPPLPAATYPPGQSYGVPFLAAITGGVLLSGYDEWTADHTVWKVKKKTYHLYPWQSKVYDITGWVAGLLQLPSLSAQIPPQDVVFCDGGGSSCVSAHPKAGQCFHISLGGEPERGLAPFPPITNVPPKDKPCLGSPDCLPYIITLTPVGESSLTVTGVEPDGALNLRVTTSAITTVNLTVAKQTCENAPTTITLSTQSPSSLPAGAPIPPTQGNPDYRSPQTPPLPLTGPLASASSTASSNDFYVPAFAQPPTKACPAAGISDTLNTPLGGWNTKGNSIYYKHRPVAAIAGTPGWDQFTVTTTVVALDLPVGPPSTFSF